MFIYGAVFSEEELISAIPHDTAAKYCLEHSRHMNIWDAVRQYGLDNPGFFAGEIPTAGKNVYMVGRPYHTMGMDETRGEFEKSVQNKMYKIIKNIDCFMAEVKDD